VLVVLRFTVDADEEQFRADALAALEALAARPGHQRGTLARAYDDPTVWCLVTEWESVGAYRRALSAYDVKLQATPLLARAQPEASAFEPLATVTPGGQVTTQASDRAEMSAP
jgi:heme oxygenase (mycobilin-producing)